MRRLLATAVIVLCAGVNHAQPPIRYRFTFPEPQHRWMQVEVAFTGLEAAPLDLRMSRSSPGRYSLHDFAKNVYDVEALGGDGRPLDIARPDPHGWVVPRHGGDVTVRYKVFGDRLDGTYLAVDSTHAHINMPAAVMWARGLEDRAATVTFTPPAGQPWRVATQLHEGATPFEFTAPNLQYLMDSPAEVGPIAMRQFVVDGHTFRFALHHAGSDAELTSFLRDVEKIVRVQGGLFGEHPRYEPGHYTFIADYLPYATGDAMEHRNSTVMTSAGTIRGSQAALLETVAHEFFHVWNVERIRPRSLEPFDFERANPSGELWLAEGFTEYYAPLTMIRAGLADMETTASTFGGMLATVALGAGRLVRSVEEMSRMAVFADGARPADRTNWSNTYISYYPFGGAVALGLDLTLRARSAGQVTLDDYMRAMWHHHGKPGGSRPGFVDRPYTMADAEARLAEVSGDAAFARDFFGRYIRGRELVDYATLLHRAGLLLRKTYAGRAWLGDLRLERRGSVVRIADTPAANSPAYEAGLDVGDELRQIDGQAIVEPIDVDAVIARRRPGESISVIYVDRTRMAKQTKIMLVENPHHELVPVESASGALSPAQRAFRTAWLGSN
jgi:predicted metalloprotease with PDZ domain